jgi:tetratricopeptide (TPR) repeat protein
MAAWDSAAGALRSSGPEVEDAVWAMLPWLRLLAVELGLRFAAYTRARGAVFTEEDAQAFIDGKAFVRLLNRYREEAARLTRDDLADGTGMWRSAVDQWLGGHALPQSKSIEYLAEVVSEAIEGLTTEEAELHLRASVAATELVGWLWGVCPAPDPGRAPALGPPRAASFGLEFTTVVHFISGRVDKVNMEVVDPWELVEQGSKNPWAFLMLSSLLCGARDSYLQADVSAVLHGEWLDRVLLMYRLLPNSSDAAPDWSSLQALDPSAADSLQSIPPAAFGPLREQERWGRLSPNPFGWHFPTFPAPPPVPEDGGTLLVASAESFPNRPDVVAKHALEAEHLRKSPHETLAHHRRLVAQDPCALHRFWLGTALAVVDRVDEALIECRMACALEPTWSVPAVEVAIILCNAGHFDEALSAIELAAQQYELDDHLALTHGRILFVMERFADAAPWYRQALSLNTESATAMRDLAHCLLVTGERAEGRRWAKAAARAGAGEVLRDLKTGMYDSP